MRTFSLSIYRDRIAGQQQFYTLKSLADRWLQPSPRSAAGFRWIVIRQAEQLRFPNGHGGAAIAAESHRLRKPLPALGTFDTAPLLGLSFSCHTLRGNASRKVDVSRLQRATPLGWLCLATLGHQKVAVIAFATQYALYRGTPEADLSSLPRAGSRDPASWQVLDRAPLMGFGSCRHRRIILERIWDDKARVFGNKASGFG